MLDPFERMRYVKGLVQVAYPKVTREEIKMSLRRITRFQQNPTAPMTQKDEVILDVMIQHKIKPGTAYSWFRVLSLPPYLQQQIRDKELSLNEAGRTNLEANRPKEVLADELRREILDYVNKVAEEDFLQGGEYAVR